MQKLILANGVSMNTIQHWLGHSTFNVTAIFYSHLGEEDDENEGKKKTAGS